jgi:hypothetical protein
MKGLIKSLRSGNSFSKRQIIRAGIPVLAMALIASVVVGRERPSNAVAEPATRIPARVDSRAAIEQDLDLSKLHREVAEAKVEPGHDPFARRSFGAGGAPASAAPQPPSAPVLPFRYLGKAIEDGKLSVFLMKGNDSFSVHARQKLDDEYRVDKVTETQVVFTYLPLKTQQVLDIPAVQ